MSTELVILAFLLIVALLVLRTVVHIVPEYQRLVVFALGRYQKTAGPGLVLLLPPPIQSSVTVDLREFSAEIPQQTCITKDNATISIAAKWLDDANNEALDATQRATAKKNYEELIRTAGFPNKPDGSKMVYRAAVRTGVVFEGAKNKARAKEFVAFLLQDENLTPYVEGALGRWFPVTTSGTQRPSAPST